MILSVEGEEKTGKTTIAYTAPLKIVGFAFDLGIDRALYGSKFEEQFKDLSIEIVPYDKTANPISHEPYDIIIYECPPPIQIDQVEVYGMIELWNYFLVRLGKAIEDPKVRSIVVDTMTIARRIKADAYLQGLQEANRKGGQPVRQRLQEIEYGNPNGAIRDIYTGCAASRKNLIALHHLVDERMEGMNSRGEVVKNKKGKRILEGLNNTYRFIDVAVRIANVGGAITSTFQECGYNLGLKGVSQKNPTWNSIVDQIQLSIGGRMRLERKE